MFLVLIVTFLHSKWWCHNGFHSDKDKFGVRAFVDNDVGLLGTRNNDLVVVNHCLEFVDFRYPAETLVDKTLFMQLLSK